ncbi:MAG: J domain-containing protein [Lachnospiraceae bacterium]|nr:J domain-containing protein [Lachnospiraceae bacterium]
MAKRDFYEVLGIERGADEKKIKSAFRKKAKQYHPDTNPGDAEAEKKFKEVNEAYAVLSDPEKKKLYDTYGMAAFEEGAGAGGAGGYQNFNGQDFSDIFSQFFGGGGGFSGFTSGGSGFSGFGGQGGFSGFGGNAGGSREPQDINTKLDITISFDEAAKGADKVMRIRGADGKMSSIKVHIPAGIDEGKSVRLKGKGQTVGGRTGDLLLKVHIQEKPGFERKGRDIYVTTDVPFTTAVFGGEVIVQTLEGPASLKIPAGTQAEAHVKMEGRGIGAVNDAKARGDLYTVVRIIVPQDLTDDEMGALMQYAQIRRMNGHM